MSPYPSPSTSPTNTALSEIGLLEPEASITEAAVDDKPVAEPRSSSQSLNPPTMTSSKPSPLMSPPAACGSPFGDDQPGCGTGPVGEPSITSAVDCARA